MKGFTHFDREGRAKMVDVTEKRMTKRSATATGTIFMKQETLNLIEKNRIAKGDVVTVAKIAGIMAGKRVSETIPLTHPIRITGCDVDFQFLRPAMSRQKGKAGVKITARMKTRDATGCEMEALFAVSCAALTVYDMCKAVEKEMVIGDICLLEKSGGRGGKYIKR
ncbi:cyclic pyranopterin monophosphate synthase MoaC [bacterium]|nr:cyclic pyranopterin monophosphate synthase MoaC [bacterium]NIN93192.1 cyclic pyranopterin monophosphate synthase MoaC [bacterium]NIO18989.1 cyclic pyranopterin monophosphate synthase MoaC [bacterium]NIO74118.1 cyclic pyranopterin monophosphate synthase MoaC [bacterium]